MTNKIVFTGVSGVAAIIIPSPDVDLQAVIDNSVPVIAKSDYVLSLGVSEIISGKVGDQLDPRIAKLNKVITSQVDFEVITEGEVPSDRTFRDAWVHDTTAAPQKIGVSATLGKDISLIRLRANRDAALVELDTEFTIAERSGATATVLNKLKAKRIALLDATEELKNLDVNNDGILSVEEAAGKFLPLELIK